MSTISKTLRSCYRCASVLGDVEALASGDPKRMARRFCRKCAYRTAGRILSQLCR